MTELIHPSWGSSTHSGWDKNLKQIDTVLNNEHKTDGLIYWTLCKFTVVSSSPCFLSNSDYQVYLRVGSCLPCFLSNNDYQVYLTVLITLPCHTIAILLRPATLRSRSQSRNFSQHISPVILFNLIDKRQ